MFGTNIATNTTALSVNVFYETSQTLWETAATATQTLPGAQPNTQEFTLTFTPTHTGTVRIVGRLQVTVTIGGALQSDCNTDAANFGSPSETFLAGVTALSFTPGLVRSGCALSSLAITGASTPASYPDALVSTFTTTAAPRSSDGTYTLSWRDATPTQFTSDTIAAGTSTSLVVNRTVNNVFPAASTAVDLLLTPASSSLSTALSGTALPWIHYTTIPSSPGAVTGTTDAAGNYVTVRFAGALTADPRLTFTHLLQVNDNTFGTPPSSKNVTSKQRLTSDLGFLSARVTNAAGAGQNSITWSTSLQDAGALTTALTNTPTSTTQGGQAGWGDTFLTWSSALPGGTWNKTCTITAPSTATGLEAGSTETYTLIAANPNLRLICGGGPSTGTADAKHFTPGNAFLCGLVVFNTSTMQTVALDTGTPAVFIGRLNLTTGKAQYLAADNVTWTDATGGTVYGHALTVSPTDANVYTKTFSAADTTNWGTADVFVIGKCTVGGVPVNDFAKEIVTSGLNNHDAYVFDGLSIIGMGLK